MKNILIILVAVAAVSCNYQKTRQTLGNKESILQNEDPIAIPLILPNSLEYRRQEFQSCANAARNNIRNFAKLYGWENLTEMEFIDSVKIFDDKSKFNLTLLSLAGVDTLIKLPETYCAALEKKILASMPPEYYSKVFPEGIEEKSFEKLLTHEIAHRLHVRILNGDEEAMGPIWFYEGFAMFVANQLSERDVFLSNQEMIKIMKEPNRGSYLKYNYIFRYFAKKVPLKDLIIKAKDENFNEELILLLT